MDDCYLVPNINPKLNKFLHAISIEVYCLESGLKTQNFFVFSVLSNFADNPKRDFDVFLQQNKIFGTFLVGAALFEESHLFNINCLFKTQLKQENLRVALLPFKIKHLEVSGEKLAVSTDLQSLFVFKWDCSDFMLENELEEFQDQVLS